MKPNRRSFLAWAGVTGAGAPLAAKAALDQAAGAVMGTTISGLGGGSIGLPAGGPAAPMTSEKYVSYGERVHRFGAYLQTVGVPKFVEEGLRDQARYVSALDPDIAAKRSWSMSVKIQEQRARNYNRNVERMLRSADYYRAKGALEKLLGFELPW